MSIWRLAPAVLFFGLLSAFVQSSSAEKDTPARFLVGVETVVVRVAVTDPLNRYVVGLEQEFFKIFENNVEQTVTHFTSDPSALSVGVVLDISGSMKDNILSARNSVIRFLERGKAEDEYFLVTFNDRTALVQDFTPRSTNIENQISISNPRGRTALYDAVYLALQKARDSRNQKKALIIITDGEDNSSRYTFKEVKDFAKESDVQIYVIGERGEMGYGRAVVSEIVRLTGGRAFFPNSFKQLDYFCDLIHTELRNQYVIGYTPSDRERNGKWRKIKIRLKPPEGIPKLSVRSREGYFAPKN